MFYQVDSRPSKTASIMQDYHNYPPAPRVNPNSNIGDLNAAIISKLISKLDHGDRNKNWRALIDVLPNNPFSLLDVEYFANKKMENKSPSKAMLVYLANHGRTVKQLIGYLKTIEHEQALLLLQVPSEDIHIIQQPVDVTLDQGDESTAVFSCHGRAFPFPRYQWYKACENEATMVPNGSDRVLRIRSVTLQDAGSYCCRLHNDRDGKVVSYLFTQWAELKVEVAPELISMSTLEVTKHPSSVTAQVGNEIMLECEVKCQFTPRYQWYRMKVSGNNLAPAMIPGKNESKLVFKQVNVDDSGHYKCKIESGRNKQWTHFAKVDIVPSNHYSSESKVPVIVRSPVSLGHVNDNETVVLACEAYGIGPLFYQWYKNGDQIPDATGPEYRIESMKPGYYGVYMCTVNNQNGEAQSTEASIQPPIQNNPITALNKVALLIGNQTYRALEKLHTPKYEVEALCETLNRECNFKVISLIDLTKKEIEFAVLTFCSLLADGMYGVFFFSGHGFENDGHSFLIPVDCTSGHKIKDCVDTQWILDQMQSRNTALNVMLLDICRLRNDYEDQQVDDQLRPKVKGNTVFGYAASPFSQSYEAEGARYSVFAKHLLKNIKKRQRIEHVLEDVKKGVQDDNTSKGQQFPTVVSDLVDHRGLCDPINSQGQTTIYNSKVQLWEEAHAIEFEPIQLRIFFDYYVYIDVRTETSNIMTILVYVNDNHNRFNVQLHHFPPELDVTVRKGHEDGYPCDVLKTTVSGLQKLMGKLEPTLCIEYMDDWRQVRRMMYPLNFGTPLVSKIWQNYKYKQPTESAYPDYDSPAHQGRGIAGMREITENLQAVSLTPAEAPSSSQSQSELSTVAEEEALTTDDSRLPEPEVE